MNRDQFNSSIRGAIKFASDVDIVGSTVSVSALTRSQDFNKIALTSDCYMEIYERALSLSYYNFQLFDFSFFQFTFSESDEYSLAFYPNPRLTGSSSAADTFRELQEQFQLGLINSEEFSELCCEMPAKQYVPRVRFEFSAMQYKNVRHPGAHFHIGMSGGDRWACSRCLSPKSFALLMIKLYFPEVWWPGSRYSRPENEQELYIDRCYEELLISAIRDDRISNSFSDAERLHFHFTALAGR